jgi:uncharacterized SAM-binding protein YcdF (DUF218 family)
LIYLHKILPLLISPIVVVLALMLLGLFKKRAAYVAVAAVLLYVGSMPIVSDALFRQIESDEVKLTPQDTPEADAIVVLGGMLVWVQSKQGLVTEWGDPDRFFAGVELMATQRAPLLIFTGGKVPWDLGLESEGHVLKRYAQRLNVPAEQILVTADVQNTEQEAREVSKLLLASSEKRKKIILVTSAFHMKRAEMLFIKAGLDVFAYPVDFRSSQVALTLMSFLPQIGALGTTDAAIRESLGVLFYKLKFILTRSDSRG